MSSINKIDEYHCIKLPLTHILHKVTKTKTITLTLKHKDSSETEHNIVIGNLSSDIILHRINDAVIRTNNIMIKSYMLLRYWVLKHYHQDQTIPLITKKIIAAVFKAICSSKGDYTGIRKESTISLIKEFHDINPYDVEDDSHLSGIFNYQKTTILTNIENNIKAHFPDYLRKYINITMEHLYPERLTEKESKKQFYIEIKQIKNDLLLNRDQSHWTCDPKYHAWLLNHRFKILPKINDSDKNYYYDVCVQPQAYLQFMIYMNLEISEIGGSMFQFCPLQTDVIPKHIPIDTKCLIEFLIDHGTGVMLANITACQNDLWETYFNIKHQSETYPFGYSIVTDGYCVSIRFVHHLTSLKNIEKMKRMAKGRALRRTLKVPPENENGNEKKPTKYKHSMIKLTPEFTYIDDVDKSLLEGDHFFFDPGYDRCLSGIGDGDGSEGEYFYYSNQQRLGDTKR